MSIFQSHSLGVATTVPSFACIGPRRPTGPPAGRSLPAQQQRTGTASLLTAVGHLAAYWPSAQALAIQMNLRIEIML